MRCTKNYNVVSGLALLVCVGLGSGLAADLPQFQPCWRGQVGTTFQTWGFSDTPTNFNSDVGAYLGPQTDPPDAGYNNPYGTPLALIVDNPAGAAIGWFSSDAGFSTTL